MDRVPSTVRRRLRLFTFVAAVSALAIGPLAFAYAEAAPADGPMISFTVTGTPPQACRTEPNVTFLRVDAGAEIIIANQTSVPARAIVGGRTVAQLAPGEGALMTLKRGQHRVRLVPECVMTTDTLAASVTVVAAAEASGAPASATPSPTPTPAPTPTLTSSNEPNQGVGQNQINEPYGGSVTTAVDPPASREPGSPGQTEASAASPTGAESTGGASTEIVAAPGESTEIVAAPGESTEIVAAPGESTETAAIPSGSAVAMAATRNADSDADKDGSRESSVIDVRSITVGDSTDPKVSRLLAVIAAICVIGVTAAIIRAIVSQRTRSAVPL
jgi:hypothetical protein